MRVALLTTSDIQSSFPPPGKAKVVAWQSPDGDRTMYTHHNLEKAMAMKAAGQVSRIVVVSTRHNPYNSDDWWRQHVDMLYWCHDDDDSSDGWKTFWEDEGMLWPIHESGHLEGQPFHWTAVQQLLRTDPDLSRIYMLAPF